MKPESRRALMELISFGMEEISSEDAAPLLARIHECTECTGQWVLIHKTIDTLSHVSEAEISSQREQQMWLVCMDHAQHKHTGIPNEQDGHLIAESLHDKKQTPQVGSNAERLTRRLEELRAPLVFLMPPLSMAMASGAMLLLWRA